MLVEFSIVPVGKGVSLGKDVAKVLKIIDRSGLPYKINPMGTVVEGRWDELMGLIRKCHNAVLKDGERVLTTIRIDDRKRKTGMIEGKIKSVEQKVGKELSR